MKTPGMNPIRMPTYSLLSRKASRAEYLNTMLKDEKSFGAFKRNLLVTATTHSCGEILEGEYMPRYNVDSQVTGFYPSPKSFWSYTHVNRCQ